jgi:hypothetical protein
MTRSTEFSDAADYLIHSHDQTGALLEFTRQSAGWECRRGQRGACRRARLDDSPVSEWQRHATPQRRDDSPLLLMFLITAEAVNTLTRASRPTS